MPTVCHRTNEVELHQRQEGQGQRHDGESGRAEAVRCEVSMGRGVSVVVKLTSRSALFVEPKWAQYLQSSGVTEAMGKPMTTPTASQRAAGQVDRIV